MDFCFSLDECTHFTWSEAGKSGTCTAKRGPASKERAVRSESSAAADGFVCGLMIGNGLRWHWDGPLTEWAHGCDFPGNDFENVAGRAGLSDFDSFLLAFIMIMGCSN